ncbi:hypothetical protein LTR05_007625 [Lithohypha guttulata]|uniref:Uncharacterized protein n=1 Tax=Lithohypha guttulata TaxID=1690604 RepID=A0AAN7YD53_9EURO|nr:hypothetical protein LTR05_007625 [Lithohypha guttulata]
MSLNKNQKKKNLMTGMALHAESNWIGEYARKRRAFFSFPNDFRFVAKFDQMEAFRECWKRHGNEQRTGSKDA